MGADRTFGSAGGARRVEDGGVVVGIDRDLGQGDVVGRRAHHLLERDDVHGLHPNPIEEAAHRRPAATGVGIVLLARHDHRLESGEFGQVVGDTELALLVHEGHLGARVGQPVGELVAGPPGVEGYGHGADGDCCPESHDPVGEVAHGDTDPVARSDAEAVHELMSQGGDGAEVLFERDPLVLVDEEVLVAVEGRQLEHGPETRRGPFPRAGGDAADHRLLHLEGTVRGGQGRRHLGPGENGSGIACVVPGVLDRFGHGCSCRWWARRQPPAAPYGVGSRKTVDR